MTNDFIFQGFTEKTHLNSINELLDQTGVERIIISVAFANMGGIDLIKDKIKKNADKVEVYIGIRNEITSAQGIACLSELGVTLYVVDTGSRLILFHPKIYLIRTHTKAYLMVGSANLTAGGLNNNIEASYFATFDLSNEKENGFIKSIENEIDSLLKKYPENILKISSVVEVEKLRLSDRLIDEAMIAPPKPIASSISSMGDNIPKIKLKVKWLARKIFHVAKKEKQLSSKTDCKDLGKGNGESHTLNSSSAVGIQYELMWQSTALTRRDLNIPDGKKTNPTGSINLDKGMLESEIDHRHYFRDDVFEKLSWQPGTNSDIEECYAKFKLVINNISRGEFDLRIAHSKNIESKSYKQKNAMTRLSWGPMREYIARVDLIGRHLSIYRDAHDHKRFVIEID